METRYFKIEDPETGAQELALAAGLLREGGLVAFPTETVYGLGANALDAQAVGRIFTAKGRPSDNPLILHVPACDWLPRYCRDIPDLAFTLAERFWPGPLTMILYRRDLVPDRTTGGLNTVAVRCPDNDIARALISLAGVPVAAPSANLSGRPSCTTAAHVLQDMDGRIDCIVDGGACQVGVESTILDLTVSPPRLLRPGGLPLEQLREVVGEISIDDALRRPMDEKDHPRAPGMKYRHYAPAAPVTAVTGSPARSAQWIRDHMTPEDGVLCYDEFRFLFPGRVRTLGSLQNRASQARQVFDALRGFDELSPVRIYAQCPDPEGLGLAVSNRLLKAAGFDVADASGYAASPSRFWLLGVTGGTGAGKTTALKELGKLGVHIIDCDQVYHELLEGSDAMKGELRERFGDEVFTGGNLDRKKLGNVVFHDEAAMADLNRITHAYIDRETNRQIEEARTAGMAGAAVDAILLLEGSIAPRCDATIGIIAPAEERVRRLIAREGVTEEYARARIAAQKSDDFYRANCTYILENTGTQSDFARLARCLFQTILEGTMYE